ncbi:protoporphyrinogen oxidase, partial [Streptomyces sp. SID335]
WRVSVHGTAGEEHLDADAVIVAVPAAQAGPLLAGVPGTGQATAALAEIPHAGSVIVTLAFPRTALDALRPLGHSGYRVPAVDGRAMKVVTFSTMKWPHLAGEVDIVRCQGGGSGAEDLLGRDDADLVALAAAELAEVTGVRGGPLDSRVSRWERAVPQYTVGHLERVARIRASVAGQRGLAVCGAAYDGVGVGQCVASALKAAEEVLGELRTGASAGSA